MNLREALIAQRPSLQLQRAAADEIAKLDAEKAKMVEVINRLVYQSENGWFQFVRSYDELNDIINPVKDLL